MNEEIKNVEAIEEPIEVVMEETVPSGNGIGKAFVIGGVVAGVVAIVALARKYSYKFEEMQIRKLEKKGYKITKEGVTEAVDVDFDNYDDAE